MRAEVDNLHPIFNAKDEILNGGFPKLGVPFWGSNNKDYSIFGSILGSPNFGKLPNFHPHGPSAQESHTSTKPVLQLVLPKPPSLKKKSRVPSAQNPQNPTLEYSDP